MVVEGLAEGIAHQILFFRLVLIFIFGEFVLEFGVGSAIESLSQRAILEWYFLEISVVVALVP